jgi:hypothetical protein
LVVFYRRVEIDDFPIFYKAFIYFLLSVIFSFEAPSWILKLPLMEKYNKVFLALVSE